MLGRFESLITQKNYIGFYHELVPPLFTPDNSNCHSMRLEYIWSKHVIFWQVSFGNIEYHLVIYKWNKCSLLGNTHFISPWKNKEIICQLTSVHHMTCRPYMSNTVLRWMIDITHPPEPTKFPHLRPLPSKHYYIDLLQHALSFSKNELQFRDSCTYLIAEIVH